MKRDLDIAEIKRLAEAEEERKRLELEENGSDAQITETDIVQAEDDDVEYQVFYNPKEIEEA